MKIRTNTIVLLIFGIVLMMISGCGKKVPTHQLEVTSFRLNIPDVEIGKYFNRVTDFDITDRNEIVVVDIAGPGVLIFDENGNFRINIAGYGSGNYEKLCSVNPVDTLLAVNTLGVLEFFTFNGKPVKRFFLSGRGDISVAADGSFVINRMFDSRRFGNCLETYDVNGKLIRSFRSPRAAKEGEEILDSAFSRVSQDNKIIYMPTVVDSGFIYDFQGELILAKKIKSKLKPYKLENGQPGALIEDLYINKDGIFIVRVDKKTSTEEIYYFDLIEQYDFNFNRIASYQFSKPLTMTVVTDLYSPWYHKFVQKDGVFYFMISQPFEQLIAFKAKS